MDLPQWDQVLAEVVCAYCFQPQHLGFTPALWVRQTKEGITFIYLSDEVSEA